MKDLKEAAREFCEDENISGEKVWLDSKGEHTVIESILEKFAQHLVDEGVLVEAKNPFNIGSQNAGRDIINSPSKVISDEEIKQWADQEGFSDACVYGRIQGGKWVRDQLTKQ